MNKSKIKRLEKSLLNDETENVTCIIVTIHAVDKEPRKMKMVLIDENGKRVSNPEMVEVNE